MSLAVFHRTDCAPLSSRHGGNLCLGNDASSICRVAVATLYIRRKLRQIQRRFEVAFSCSTAVSAAFTLIQRVCRILLQSSED